MMFKEFLFDPIEDLMKLKDIPKVTRCLALMAKMVKMILIERLFSHFFITGKCEGV